MELPFLKKKNRQGGDVIVQHEGEGLHGMVADQLMESFHSKDIHGLKDSLRALIHLIKTKDEDHAAD